MTQNRLRIATADTPTVNRMVKIAENLDISANEALLAFDCVAGHLGLNSNDVTLMHALVANSEPQDWLLGERPVVWPTDAELQHFTMLCPRDLKHHISNLVQADLILITQSADKERYGLRDEDGYVIEACGFDLSPLVARTAEFEWLAEALDHERRVGDCAGDEAVDLVGSILATLTNAASLTQNAALYAMKFRFQLLLASLAFQGGETLLFPNRVSSFFARWTGAQFYLGDERSDESENTTDGELADSQQPDPGAEYSQIADEMMSDYRCAANEAQCFYGSYGNADLEQPELGSYQNICIHEKSWFVPTGNGNLINGGLLRTTPILTAFTEMPIEVFRTTQIPEHQSRGSNRRTSSMRVH